jgi:hypothetical protein
LKLLHLIDAELYFAMDRDWGRDREKKGQGQEKGFSNMKLFGNL